MACVAFSYDANPMAVFSAFFLLQRIQSTLAGMADSRTTMIVEFLSNMCITCKGSLLWSLKLAMKSCSFISVNPVKLDVNRIRSWIEPPSKGKHAAPDTSLAPVVFLTTHRKWEDVPIKSAPASVFQNPS